MLDLVQHVMIKISIWGFWKLFPTGTYAIIGTTCVEFENVTKSTTKKQQKKTGSQGDIQISDWITIQSSADF